MMRDYIPAELINTAAMFQPKAKESIQALLMSTAMGYRGQWCFSDWAGGRENEEHPHTPCPLAAPALCGGFKVLAPS